MRLATTWYYDGQPPTLPVELTIGVRFGCVPRTPAYDYFNICGITPDPARPIEAQLFAASLVAKEMGIATRDQSVLRPGDPMPNPKPYMAGRTILLPLWYAPGGKPDPNRPFWNLGCPAVREYLAREIADVGRTTGRVFIDNVLTPRQEMVGYTPGKTDAERIAVWAEWHAEILWRATVLRPGIEFGLNVENGWHNVWQIGVLRAVRRIPGMKFLMLENVLGGDPLHMLGIDELRKADFPARLLFHQEVGGIEEARRVVALYREVEGPQTLLSLCKSGGGMAPAEWFD